MKKIVALILALCFLLSGCSIVEQALNLKQTINADEDDSIVSFNIYPETEYFKFVDKFARPEYLNLSEVQKSIYILLDNAIYDMKSGYIKLGTCNEKDVEHAYLALRNDRPEYFWIPSSYTLRSKGNNQEICVAETESDWKCTQAEREKNEAEIKNVLKGFLATVNKNDSQYARELKAHDWLCETIEYDDEALSDYEKYYEAWTVSGAFLNGKSVCEGYSRAMQVLCFMLGLECSLVAGVTDDSHMWNIVKIDGQYYHVDVTSDDGAKYGTYHFFFNVTTEYMEASRKINPYINNFDFSAQTSESFNTFLPLCTANKYNYHITNSQYITSSKDSETIIVNSLREAVKSKKKSVEFAVSPEMGFVFGTTDAAEFFDIEKCIAAANSKLSYAQRLRSYSYGGVDGALGFRISW